MKKNYFLVLCMVIVMCCIFISGCKKNTESSNSALNLADSIKGTYQDEVHKTLGKPLSTLSGFWGDVYTLDNDTKIVVYYDKTGKVEKITVSDKEGTRTLNIE